MKLTEVYNDHKHDLINTRVCNMKKSILFVLIQSCLLQQNEAFRNTHIARRRQHGLDLLNFEPSNWTKLKWDHTGITSFQIKKESSKSVYPNESSERRINYDPFSIDTIIGAPSWPNHLPEAEAILPGHTLVRPSFGMLKSAVSFPHRELEGGFGVDGNYDNLGIKYDGKNERVLYSGFRRMPMDYLMVIPKETKSRKPSFDLASLVLDLENDKNYEKKLLEILNKNKNKSRKNNLQVYFIKSDSRKPLISPSFYVRDESNVGDANELNYYLKPKKQTSVKKYLFKTLKNLLDHRRDEPNSLEKLQSMKLELEKEHKDREKPWIEKARALFTTIKIRSDAPEYTDLVPKHYLDSLKKPKNEKSWWFYNQADFKPFEDRKYILI